jgi:hypothetical protein
MGIRSSGRPLLLVTVAICALLAGGATRVVQDQCGPFTDVTPAFCPYILELYYLGVTAGTSATTFSPDDPLTRGQGSVFVAKGLNQALARSSRRAALGQWWQPRYFLWNEGLAVTPLPDVVLGPVLSDGADVWVGGSTSVFRVRASDAKLLDTWTIASPAGAMLSAMGRIFVAGGSFVPESGVLYMIDPSAPPGAATEVATLPSFVMGIAFDGSRIWTANDVSVSIITPSATLPWPVTTVTTGIQFPSGAAFDGQNIWLTDTGACALFKLDGSGAIAQTVGLGTAPCPLYAPVFDGSNILVPAGDSLRVVHANDGTLAATIPIPTGAALVSFGGERILVESFAGGQNAPRGLTLLRAADFAVLQSEGFPGIGGPEVGGIASDGVNFWVTFRQTDWVLGRY